MPSPSPSRAVFLAELLLAASAAAQTSLSPGPGSDEPTSSPTLTPRPSSDESALVATVWALAILLLVVSGVVVAGVVAMISRRGGPSTDDSRMVVQHAKNSTHETTPRRASAGSNSSGTSSGRAQSRNDGGYILAESSGPPLLGLSPAYASPPEYTDVDESSLGYATIDGAWRRENVDKDDPGGLEHANVGATWGGETKRNSCDSGDVIYASSKEVEAKPARKMSAIYAKVDRSPQRPGGVKTKAVTEAAATAGDGPTAMLFRASIRGRGEGAPSKHGARPSKKAGLNRDDFC